MQVVIRLLYAAQGLGQGTKTPLTKLLPLEAWWCRVPGPKSPDLELLTRKAMGPHSQSLQPMHKVKARVEDAVPQKAGTELSGIPRGDGNNNLNFGVEYTEGSCPKLQAIGFPGKPSKAVVFLGA